MLSWIKCSWDQTGKQDWRNVFDIRGKQSLTLFKSDCWCIKRYALGGGSRQLKFPTQDSLIWFAKQVLVWDDNFHLTNFKTKEVHAKSMENTNRNSFSPATRRSVPSSWKCFNLSKKFQWCSKAKTDQLWDFHHALVGNFFQSLWLSE